MDGVRLPTDLAGKRVLVFGAGRAGRAAVRLALAKGARVTLTDGARPEDLGPEVAGLRDEADPSRLRLVLGGHPPSLLEDADLVVKSPGIPWIDILKQARSAGLPVVDEVELASWYLQGTVAAVTGTNGKSTTVALLGHLLETTGRPVFVGGNIGQPLSLAVGTEAGRRGFVVVELSSFQLETIHRFRAHLAVLTNLSPDHLDRHGDLGGYFAAKARLFLKQRGDDLAVYNADQPECERLVASGPARRLGFSRRRSLEVGAFSSRDGRAVFLRADPRGPLARVGLEGFRLVGAHNRENALAACLAAWLLGAQPGAMERALSSFRGLPHRMEHVARVGGVDFYDDSKATNVGSAVGSLSGLEGPIVLIAGGRHKGASYEPLRAVLEGRLRGLVLLGEAAPLLEAELGDLATTQRAEDMREAVEAARRLAQPGDSVVLCPACSSYDMFRDYEERGRAFAEAVRSLEAR